MNRDERRRSNREALVELVNMYRAHDAAIALCRMVRSGAQCIHGTACTHGCARAVQATALSAAADARRRIQSIITNL